MKFDIPENDKFKSGVYMLVSTVTEDTYIGATRNLYRRFLGHKSRKASQDDTALGEYKRKYGSKTLIMRCLVICEPSKRQELELEMIKRFVPSLNMLNGAGASIKKNENSVKSLEPDFLVIEKIYPKPIAPNRPLLIDDGIETIGSWRNKTKAA